MAVLMIIEAPGATTAEYDRTNEILGIHGDDDAPEGLIEHAAASDGNGLVIADVWESEEALGRFFEERLGAALEESGVAAAAQQPRRLPVHNALRGRGAHAGALLVVEIDGFTPELYDKMTEGMDVHAGDGADHPSVWHAVGVKDDGNLVVADVWESPEAFGQFAQDVIGPRGQEVGMPQFEPRLIPVHNSIRGRAALPA